MNTLNKCVRFVDFSSINMAFGKWMVVPVGAGCLPCMPCQGNKGNVGNPFPHKNIRELSGKC